VFGFELGLKLTDAERRFVDDFLDRRQAIAKWTKPLTLDDWIGRWIRFVEAMPSYLYEEYANECNAREILGRELIDVAPPVLRAAIMEVVSATDDAYLQTTLPVSKPWSRVRDERYRWLYQRCPERWLWYREHRISP